VSEEPSIPIISVLLFCSNWLKWSVPAICTETYLTQQRQNRAIRVRQFKDHIITSNILDSQVTKNSKVPSFQTEQYRHLFFVTTVVDWNHLADDIVDALSCEAFQSCVAKMQSCPSGTCPLCIGLAVHPSRSATVIQLLYGITSSWYVNSSYVSSKVLLLMAFLAEDTSKINLKRNLVTSRDGHRN